MKSNTTKILLTILIVSTCCSCVIIPTISQTHLIDDIRAKNLSVNAGIELPIGESPGVLPDVIYEYVSYAPTDWFEIGVAGHYGIAAMGADLAVDVVDIVTDDSPWSALIVGGVLLSTQGGSLVIAHAGAAVNYRLNHFLELYASAGTNSPFFAPLFHIGANISPLRWLSLSANLKLAINTMLDEDSSMSPLAVMVSFSPSLHFDLQD